jgi:hypothetical protein
MVPYHKVMSTSRSSSFTSYLANWATNHSTSSRNVTSRRTNALPSTRNTSPGVSNRPRTPHRIRTVADLRRLTPTQQRQWWENRRRIRHQRSANTSPRVNNRPRTYRIRTVADLRRLTPTQQRQWWENRRRRRSQRLASTNSTNRR